MTDNTAREGSQILGATEEASEFANLLLQEFKPKTERAREAVETAVRTLAEQALAQTDLVSNDAIKSIESIIAAIDAKLTARVQLKLDAEYPTFTHNLLEIAYPHYLASVVMLRQMRPSSVVSCAGTGPSA